MLTYLLVNLGAFIVPFLFSFHPALKFYRSWKALWPAMLCSAVFFVVWDIYFTGRGVWGFDPRYITGAYLFGLPLEEYLFFFCIPYATVFSYHCMNILVKKDVFKRTAPAITLTLAAGFLLLGILCHDKLYTSFISITAAITLVAQHFFFRLFPMHRFYITLLFIMIPFSITNGILTGSWFGKAVFWYNANDILSIRWLTIPVEDIFYTVLLLLANIGLYEFFLQRIKNTSHVKA